MLSFVEDDLGSIIILIVLAAIVGLIIFYMIRKHMKGKSCNWDCGDCGLSGNCHTQDKLNSKKAKEAMLQKVEADAEKESNTEEVEEKVEVEENK